MSIQDSVTIRPLARRWHAFVGLFSDVHRETTPHERHLAQSLAISEASLASVRAEMRQLAESHETVVRDLRRDIQQRDDALKIHESSLALMALEHQRALARARAEIGVWGNILANATSGFRRDANGG